MLSKPYSQSGKGEEVQGMYKWDENTHKHLTIRPMYINRNSTILIINSLEITSYSKIHSLFFSSFRRYRILKWLCSEKKN